MKRAFQSGHSIIQCRAPGETATEPSRLEKAPRELPVEAGAPQRGKRGAPWLGEAHQKGKHDRAGIVPLGQRD